MKIRSIILALSALVLVFGSAAINPQDVHAQSGGGTGTLEAQGDGMAGIRGGGTIELSGNGTLWVRDRSGDGEIEISGEGRRIRLPGRRVYYVGFDGHATITGSALTLTLTGRDIDLHAQGTGSFLLRGKGTYVVNGETGEWPAELQTFTLDK